VAVPLNVVYEPGTKKVRSATVSLSVADKIDVQDWELEIRDKSGRVVRVIKGSGVPPAFVTWDGKDALGAAMDDADEVNYQLNIKTGSGLRSSGPSFAMEGSLQAAGLEPAPMAESQALVVPVMDAEGKATQLELRPPSVPGETQRWEVVIQNDAGETLKTISGVGPLPTNLTWDGKDDGGQKALNQSGLRVRFNAWDTDNRLNSVDQGLDAGLQPVEEAESALPRLGLKLPAFREGGPTLALILSDATLAFLPEPTPEPTPSGAVTPPPSPSPTPCPVPTHTATPQPTRTPTSVPTEPPTAVPTRLPTERPTAVPTASPIPAPTAPPTPVPTPRPTQAPDTGAWRSPAAKAGPAEAAALGAGLSRSSYLDSADRLPPVFMTLDQAEGRHRAKASGGDRGPRRRRLPASIGGVIDVFVPGSAELDLAKADKLQAFFWRLSGYRTRRIQLTGLVGEDEPGGEGLSRDRARAFSRWMVEDGGFNGEFILKVDGQRGPEKGVRVEVLRR
jgi:hypothetical protein